MEITAEVLEQIKSAYRTMAEKANYRPGADSAAELLNEITLEAEAEDYAWEWWGNENSGAILGPCYYPWRKAMIYSIEATRLMRFGEDLEYLAKGVRKTPAPIVQLLRLALDELQAWQKEGER